MKAKSFWRLLVSAPPSCVPPVVSRNNCFRCCETVSVLRLQTDIGRRCGQVDANWCIKLQSILQLHNGGGVIGLSS